MGLDETERDGVNRFVGTVRDVIYLGVYAEIDNGRRVLANVRHGNLSFSPGERVCLSFVAADCRTIVTSAAESRAPEI